ncbi:uncharacterized protein [Porites lutea]|uniref:uncharacterized protein n=1 Tax=Porites lutea TaxID=51062 RepID=UPI003CC567DE
MVPEGFANFIPKEDWPANSCDVNPLETIWIIADKTTYHKDPAPKTLDELRHLQALLALRGTLAAGWEKEAENQFHLQFSSGSLPGDCESSCEQVDVGVSWYILDNQLNASSELNASTPAKNGRLNFVAGSSWCASTSDTSPYLQVDLQIPHIICAVSTQGNSQGSQWVKSYTLQSSTDGTTWTGYEENGQVKTFNGNFDQNSVVKQILFSAFVARYLRFIVGPKHGEACLRVEVFGIPRIPSNIAFSKNASQSSSYTEPGKSFPASNAVDGDRSTNIDKCTHTLQDNTAWWRVDLGRVEPVAEVNILNRNSHAARLNGAEIRVGNDTTNGGANNHLCATNIRNIPQGGSKTFSCIPKAYGRYLYIRLTNMWLTLCEVEVYSYLKTEISPAEIEREILLIPQNKTYRFYSCPIRILTDVRCVISGLRSIIMTKSVQKGVFPAKLKKAKVVPVYQNDDKPEPAKFSFCLVADDTNLLYAATNLKSLEKTVNSERPKVSYWLNANKLTLTAKKSNHVIFRPYQRCAFDPVGVSADNDISKQRFSASSSLSGRSPSDGQLGGSNAWIPANNDNNAFLQIDLGSRYFVCAVATQGNPDANDWTKTYKIKTSLDNVWRTFYSEGGSEKTFTGNGDRNSIVRNELSEPLAAKFIRFYPVTFQGRKALRVEVYGSKQGCFESFKNERFQLTRDFTITASSQNSSHTASYSRLYGTDGWCSSSASLPQYLQADFNKIVTVTGVATQGDAKRDNWVTNYLIRYGYDGKTWISYETGQHLTGNSDRSTIVVHRFTPPFAAQYVRIFPTTYTGAICMRMDLFGCKNCCLQSSIFPIDRSALRAAMYLGFVSNLLSRLPPPA